MLQRFESFKPRNIDARQEKLKELNRKDEQKLMSLIPKLEQKIADLKLAKSSNEKFQYLKETFQDTVIKYDFSKYPKTIFFFEREDGPAGHDLTYLAEYNLNEFWIKAHVFNLMENWVGHSWTRKILNSFLNEYLDLKDFALEDGTNYRPAEEVEIHFMRLEQSNESFTPRNMKGRQEELDRINAKKLKEVTELVETLKERLKGLSFSYKEKHLKLTEEDQVFLRTFLNSNVSVNKYDESNPNIIFKMDRKWLAEYTPGIEHLFYSEKYVREPFIQYFGNDDFKRTVNAFQAYLREKFSKFLGITVKLTNMSVGMP